MIGQIEPYTEEELANVKCACGEPAKFQWNCCANDNRWVGVCFSCDLILNTACLVLFGFQNPKEVIQKYIAQME